MSKPANDALTYPRGAHTGFGTRLLIAQALVLVAGAMTSWLVASAVGPAIFHDHLQRAGIAHTSAEAGHAEEAFASAMIVSMLVAVLASVVMALAVTWYLTRRVQRSIVAVADSASEIATGRYTSRVPSPRLGGEFEQLAATFNRLAERLDAVESTRRRMLADLAHEMRTPLATLDAHLEAIEDGVRQVDEPTVSVLRSSTRRLSRLARDVGAVSRAEEGALEVNLGPARPGDLVKAAMRAARADFQAKGVSLIEDIDTDATVSIDGERMGQVLGNLLDNALRHTPAGGTVTLACRRLDDRWAEISVRDSGEGVAPEHLAHAFDRFYRVDTARDRKHGGSGIGLTIARALVEAQGGRISAHSAGPSQGATFTVRLPVAG